MKEIKTPLYLKIFLIFLSLLLSLSSFAFFEDIKFDIMQEKFLISTIFNFIILTLFFFILKGNLLAVKIWFFLPLIIYLWVIFGGFYWFIFLFVAIAFSWNSFLPFSFILFFIIILILYYIFLFKFYKILKNSENKEIEKNKNFSSKKIWFLLIFLALWPILFYIFENKDNIFMSSKSREIEKNFKEIEYYYLPDYDTETKNLANFLEFELWVNSHLYDYNIEQKERPKFYYSWESELREKIFSCVFNYSCYWRMEDLKMHYKLETNKDFQNPVEVANLLKEEIPKIFYTNIKKYDNFENIYKFENFYNNNYISQYLWKFFYETEKDLFYFAEVKKEEEFLKILKINFYLFEKLINWVWDNFMTHQIKSNFGIINYALDKNFLSKKWKSEIKNILENFWNNFNEEEIVENIFIYKKNVKYSPPKKSEIREYVKENLKELKIVLQEKENILKKL